MKAQMGLPDMKLPIQYALTYPERIKTDYKRFNFANYAALNFELPDKLTFRNLELAYQAMDSAGNMPCILNAANEIAVAAFLQDKIGFLEIAELNEKAMHHAQHSKIISLESLLETDNQVREMVRDWVDKK